MTFTPETVCALDCARPRNWKQGWGDESYRAGGQGRAPRLKIYRRKSCGFDSHPGHQPSLLRYAAELRLAGQRPTAGRGVGGRTRRLPAIAGGGGGPNQRQIHRPMFYVYLIESKQEPKQVYVGLTTDLRARFSDQVAAYRQISAVAPRLLPRIRRRTTGRRV